MSGPGFGLLELIRDRGRKHGLYDTAAYWDKKARAYSGLARSNWPSNAYNALVHSRQVSVIDDLLGDVTGLHVADVGAGTGRISLHLARRGAKVHGFDFSPLTLAVARADADAAGLDVGFTEHDLRHPFPTEQRGAFDVAVVVGCLALSCHDLIELEHALGRIASLVRPGGRVLLLEPIHRHRLLVRILRASVDEWCDRARRWGLALERRRGLMFVPSRYLLAFVDLPSLLTRPTFAVGERALDAGEDLGLGAKLEPLADYKVLLFRHTGPPSDRETEV